MNSEILHPSPLDLPPYETPFGAVQQPMPPEQARDILAHLPAGPETTDSLAWTNYASALYIEGRDDEALVAAERAVQFGRNSTTLMNLGIVLEAFGRFVDALVLFAEAQALDPRNVAAGAAYSDGLVRLGRWGEGWRLYAQYHSKMTIDYLRLPKLEELKGKRILVVSNGGAGDNFYHLRWLRSLHEQGCKVTFAGEASLLSVLKGHPWIDHELVSATRTPVIEWHTQGGPSCSTDESYSINLNEFDVYLSSLAVAAVVRPVRYSSSRQGSYIQVKHTKWFWPSRKMQVGICWKAGEKRFPRRHRTLGLQQVLSLVRANPKVQWVSLVPDEASPREVLRPYLRNWRDTAEVINALDLVVTVDTGTAHLAGAMGKQVWVILPAASAWPYGLGQDHLLAYPTMTAFRSTRGIDQAVVAAVQKLEGL